MSINCWVGGGCYTPPPPPTVAWGPRSLNCSFGVLESIPADGLQLVGSDSAHVGLVHSIRRM